MELHAARFGSSAMHNEQVMLGCVRSPCYQHQLHKLKVIRSSASEVGWDGEQVVPKRKGEK